MKNVLVNKIAQLVATENQLRSYWKKLGEDVSFESLTNEQLMELGKKLIAEASHHELESHLIDRGWRTKDEIDGKMIAEDNSDPSVHIELIDTNQQGIPSKIIIDRLLEFKCKSCQFEFLVQDLDVKQQALKCPLDGGEVELLQSQLKKIYKEK
ncbi:hypothetical protein [Calidifontibacillus oryziterrae]|uniref:hypothetical protein n=1 Tax=Calidifontibacillus oryziterrae TaxID=1191699 RepID=UPI000307D2C5|nr:hypothetical protein [Calidifontibacillus oryziterrae]